MEKATFKTAMVLMLVTQIALVACGDGGKRRRQPINRSGMQKGLGQTPQNKNGDRTSGSPIANPTDIKVKSGKKDKMKLELDQRSSGNAVSANQLEEGLYSLEEVVSHVEFYDSARGDDAEILNIYANNALSLNKIGGDSVGLASNYADMGRQMIVPYKFFVKGQKGQAWTPKRDQSVSEALLVTAMEMKAGSSTLSDSFRPGADAVDEIALIKVIGTQPGSIEKEIAYEAADHAGKKIYVRLRKSADSKLRLIVSVLEEGASAATDASKAQGTFLKRTLIFSFSRQPLAGEQAPTSLQPQQVETNKSAPAAPTGPEAEITAPSEPNL